MKTIEQVQAEIAALPKRDAKILRWTIYHAILMYFMQGEESSDSEHRRWIGQQAQILALHILPIYKSKNGAGALWLKRIIDENKRFVLPALGEKWEYTEFQKLCKEATGQVF